MNYNSKKIIFESHATSLDNEQKIASGWLDPSLSQKGIEQAKEMGLRYEKEDISIIYASDLSRSYKTAEIAFGNRNIPIIKDKRLREWNYGKYNGCTNNEVDALKIKYVNSPFPLGESLKQVYERFFSFHEECLLKTDKGPILIIGHRATFYSLEFLFKKIPLEALLTQPWKWQPGWPYYLHEKS